MANPNPPTGPAHPMYRHGHSVRKVSPTYEVWSGIIKRCLNLNYREFHLYGGRGITVCDRWRDFVNFFADMGEKPPGLSIDRIDNDGNYEPGNCKWSTAKEQANNRRPKYITLLDHCSHGHKYTPETERFTSSGSRYCRACHTTMQRERRAFARS